MLGFFGLLVDRERVHIVKPHVVKPYAAMVAVRRPVPVLCRRVAATWI